MDDFDQEPQGWFARNAPQPGNTGQTPNSGAVPPSQLDPNYSWFAANAPLSARKPAAVTSWKQDLENDLRGNGGAVKPGDGYAGWGVRPETADFLHDLAGIGTGAYLDMRNTPGYQQWRDRNFTPVGSGKFVSPGGGGQGYTQAQLRQMHGLLSRQAGNPLISALFNGPKSPVADFMTWRNQNFVPNQGTYQDEDGTPFSHQELESMFAAKSQARPQVQNPTGGANQGSVNRQQPQLLAQNAPAPQAQPSPGAAGVAAGNPPFRVTDPAQELADFMRWRNQNFRPTQDGRWEGTDARVRTNEEVRGLYYAQREAQAEPQSRPQTHLTAGERQEAAAVAYSENTRGSVAEHEAIISVLLNRAQSGDRQYVDPGQDVNLHNVASAHTRGGVQQFQGVHHDQYNEFANATNPGSQNARTAAANIAQTGSTNQATSFIATTGRNPTRAEEAGLGHNMQQIGRVGNVFLYAPAPPPHNPPGPRRNPQPQRQQQQQRGPGAGTTPPLQQPND